MQLSWPVLWGKHLPIRPAIVDVRVKDGKFLRLSRDQEQPTEYHTRDTHSPTHAQAPSRPIQATPGDPYGSPYTTVAHQHAGFQRGMVIGSRLYLFQERTQILAKEQHARADTGLDSTQGLPES